MMVNRKFGTFLKTLIKDGVAFRRDIDKSIIAWCVEDGIMRCFGPVVDEDKISPPSQGNKIDLHDSASIEAMQKAYNYCHGTSNCGGCQLWKGFD